MKFVKKALALSLTLTLAAAPLTACSGNDRSNGGSNSSTPDASASTQSADDKTKVVVATAGNPTPFVYLDENGTLAGFEVEVLKEIFSRLPQYDLQFEVTEFTSMFTGLDAGYYQIAMNHFAYNKMRAEKYIYSDVFGVDERAIAVREDNEDIKSVYDLPGHSTHEQTGNFNSAIYEKYNEEHPDNPIQVDYTENFETLLEIVNGNIDFYWFTKKNIETQIEEKGIQGIKLIDVSNDDGQEFSQALMGDFFLIAKEEEQLAADISQAFETVLADGTLQKLREEFLGETENPLTQEYVDYAREFIANDLAGTN